MLVMSEFLSRILKKQSIEDPSFAQDEQAVTRISHEAMRDPDAYAHDDEDRALIRLSEAVNTARREIEDVEDTDLFGDVSAGAQDLVKTRAQLRACLNLDSHCYDARQMLILAESTSDDEALAQLLAIEQEALDWCTEQSQRYDKDILDTSSDPWDAVFMRPYLRIEAKIIDLLVMSARYRGALARCMRLLDAAPTDGQGIRHTTALILARLEDEQGLDNLDKRFDRTGSTWMHIARAVLLYKLGRMDAARRATIGLATLCPGVAFYLASPTYVDPYLPDRPPFSPGTIQESLYATYEADFLVVDTPDFINWALSIETFSRAVQQDAQRYGDEF